MILDLPTLPVPLRPEELFGRTAPLEIEIGVGKGRFLRERSGACPDRDFLGIEKSRKYLLHAAERIEKSGVRNVRLVVTYAEEFLERYIPDGTVSIYHVQFPDPWPKRRHQKRRLFAPRFLNQVLRTLIPGGELQIATDHKLYFDHILHELTAFSRNGLEVSPAEPGPFLSNFQAKYLKEGRPLFYLRGQKTGTGEPLTKAPEDGLPLRTPETQRPYTERS
jgi:tRNA (guanine-N7-)-methyltransferase